MAHNTGGGTETLAICVLWGSCALGPWSLFPTSLSPMTAPTILVEHGSISFTAIVAFGKYPAGIVLGMRKYHSY